VSRQILAVFVLDGELLGAHEEEMFNGMSHTRNIRFIAKITNVDIEGSTGLVCLGIVD